MRLLIVLVGGEFVTMAADHRIGFTHEPLALRDAAPKFLLILLKLAGLAIPLSEPMLFFRDGTLLWEEEPTRS